MAAVAAASWAPATFAQVDEDPPDGFSDVTGGVHKPAIDALDALGLFAGTECGEGMFCPGEELRRWTMAVWLVRAVDDAEPPAAEASSFADVDAGEWWLPYVERLAALEITKGCRTEPLSYCPERPVNRAQMASFLVRAFDLEAAGPAGFGDVNENSVHKANIDALAAARVTVGCRTEPLSYCPDRPVTRAQMATFLARALGLVEVPDPTSTPLASHRVPGFERGLVAHLRAARRRHHRVLG